MLFGHGLIGFGFRPSREGPVALQRGLPDYFRTLTTDALKELALGFLVPGLNPPCLYRVELAIVPAVASGRRVVLVFRLFRKSCG
jgi:hypothetical protein